MKQYLCRFLGYQNTYYTWGDSGTGRMYHKNCIIKGTTDFIFGRNICVFDSCTFFIMKSGSALTAGGTDASSQYGYVFRNCILLGDSTAYTDSAGYAHSSIPSFYLGRPWQNNPRTVYMHCYEPATLATAGWTTMQVNPTLYAEYNCYGPGFTASRGTISAWPTANQPRQLTDMEASTYSLSTIFARNSASSSFILYNWMPMNATSGDDMPIIVSVEKNLEVVSIPREFSLSQNYPNPFNPTTKINYHVSEFGKVSLKVYDIFGREVATLVNGVKAAGTYCEVFDGKGLASGVYFARLTTEGTLSTIKLVLTK